MPAGHRGWGRKDRQLGFSFGARADKEIAINNAKAKARRCLAVIGRGTRALGKEIDSAALANIRREFLADVKRLESGRATAKQAQAAISRANGFMDKFGIRYND